MQAAPTIETNNGRVADPLAPEAERTVAVLTHLTALLALLDGGMGLVGVIVAAVLWRTKGRTSPFLEDHCRESLNFQLSLLALGLGGILAGVVFTIVTFGIGAFIWIFSPLFVLGLLVLRIVGSVRGAMAANRGEFYRYPMCFRFFRGPADSACWSCGADLSGVSTGASCPSCGAMKGVFGVNA